MSWTVTEEIHQLLGRNLERLESPSLRLEKMLYLERKQDNKDKQIDAVVKCHEVHAKFPAIGFSDVSAAKRFVMKLRARLLVNHAGGVLENTGLCLHRHFGCRPPCGRTSAAALRVHLRCIVAVSLVGAGGAWSRR